MDKKSEDAATVIMIAWLVAFYLSICIDTPFAWILFAMFTISEALIVYLDYLTEKRKETSRHDSRPGKARISMYAADSVSKSQQRQHY
jgi:hypothetical protein